MTKTKSKRKNNIVDSLNKLKEQDIYSILLHCLYKLKDDAKYSTLSSLMWALDKENLFNLLTLFGGIEIRVPTVSELKQVIFSLQVYQVVDVDKTYTVEDAIEELDFENISKDTIRSTYFELRTLMNKGKI